MYGIHNIEHCVMTWYFSNCKQGSGTCVLVFFHRHITRIYFMKEKQGGPDKSEVLIKGSKWVLHTQMGAA